MVPHVILWYALHALHTAKIRTLLNTLGIAIGTTAILCTMSITRASLEFSVRNFSSMGSNIVIISVTNENPFRRLPLTKMKHFIEVDPSVSAVTAVQSQRVVFRRSAQTVEAELLGIDGQFFKALSIDVLPGSKPPLGVANSFDILMGNDTARLIGIEPSKLPAAIQASGRIMEVVGILAPVAPNPALPFNINQSVLIRSKSLARLDGAIPAGILIAKYRNEEDIVTSTKFISSRLSFAYPKNTVGVQAPLLLIEGLRAQSASNSALLVATGCLSLLVSGISIMNSMLISVSERQSEIGIRMALGASKRTITVTFLIEAALLAFAGVFLGMIVGLIITFFYTANVGWPFVLNWLDVGLAFLLPLCMIIAFGIYPAWKAANISPQTILKNA